MWKVCSAALQLRPYPAPPAPQVLTSSGLAADKIKHLAGGVYGYANSGMPMVRHGGLRWVLLCGFRAVVVEGFPLARRDYEQVLGGAAVCLPDGCVYVAADATDSASPLASPSAQHSAP